MKRFTSLILCLLVTVSAFSAYASGIDMDTKNVVVRGTAPGEGTVTILIKDTSGKIAYINETDLSDNEYFAKFKLPIDNPSAYTLSVKAGTEDVTKGVLEAAVASDDKFECLISLTGSEANKYFTVGDILKLETTVTNLYADEEIYNIYLAFYDEQGKLISAKKGADISVDYGEDGSKQTAEYVPDIEVPQNTAEVKVFAWTKGDMTPLGVARVQKPDDNLYQNGDIVVNAGDSITHGGIYTYVIEHYYQTRYPDRKIQFFNKGINGQTAGNIYNRLDWDIFAEGTNRMTLMVGFNDLYEYFASDTTEAKQTQGINTCIANYKKIIDECKKNNVEICLVTPVMADGYAPLVGNEDEAAKLRNVNAGLTRLSTELKALADEEGIDLYDINTHTNAVTEAGREKGMTQVIAVSDGIHPSDTGSYVLGYLFLKEQGAGNTVASVSIDGEEVIAENASVSGLTVSENGVSFTYSPKALPMAVSSRYSEAEELVPDLTADLNNETLIVKNLEEGTYTLMLDGTNAGTYTADNFAQGVNIAVLDANPNQVISKTAYNKIMQKDSETDKLRTIAKTEYFAIAGGYDVSTDEGYAAFMDRYGSSVYGGYFRNYKTYKDDEYGIKQRVKLYTEKAAALCVPASYSVSISKN